MLEFLAGASRAALPPAVCFGALCWLNCTQIYEREHTDLREAHWSTRFAVRHASLLLTALAAAGLVLYFRAASLPGAATALSAGVLLVLHRFRTRMDRLTFRIAVDAALLTPLLIISR